MKETLDRFRGTTVALVTPFRENGAVDLDAFAAHVDRMVTGGVDTISPCGTTGESVTLTFSEQAAVIQAAVRAAGGRASVMAGAGTNDTKDAVALAKAAVKAGADAILSVAPYYNKPPQEGLYRHFRAVAEAAEIPLFLYNVPGRTSCNLLPETAFRLAEIPNIVGIKEASGSIEQVSTLLAGRPEGFLVLSGDDELTLPMLALGADGLVSVAANEAPGPISRMVSAGLSGDFVTARALHFQLLDLMRANFAETNPIPVKTAVEILGGAPARFRSPLVPMGDATRARLVRALESAGLLPAGREVA
jgi:4-hydroxy-tetrahydrodipicolinate synthase